MQMLPQTNHLALTIGPLAIPARSAMDQAIQLGVRSIQLSTNHDGMRPRELGHSARRDLLATIRRHGLELAGVDLWIPMDHFDSSELRDRAIDAVLAVIALAEDLGRICVSTALPFGVAHTQAIELVNSEAQRRGVAVANHTPQEEIQTESQVGIGIDPAAVIASGGDPAQVAFESGHRCKSARLSDLLRSGARGPIGHADGQLDVTAYRAALAAIGYDRPVVLDCRGWQDPWLGIQQSIDRWQQSTPAF